MITHASDTTRGWLAPRRVYNSLQLAMEAASCLSGLDPAGATIYGTTHHDYVDEDSGEAYQVACAARRTDGTTWPAPDAPYEAIYTITRART